MQNPVEEVCPLVARLISAPTPAALRTEVETYFLPSAGFRHPLCLLDRGPRSRNALLGIYEWYRTLSPHTTGKSRVLAWNEETGLLVVETIQLFHLHMSPSKMAPARLVTNVMLERDEDTKLWYIAFQEDFYHPDHFMNLIIPPFVPLIRFMLWIAVLLSGWLAPLGHAFGIFTDLPSSSVHYTPPDTRPVTVPGERRSRQGNVEVTLNLNPLHLVGHVLLGFDRLVRRRGVRFDAHDIVEATPGEEEMILYGCRSHDAKVVLSR